MHAFQQIEDDENHHKLVRIMAGQFHYFTKDKYDQEYVFFDDYEASPEELRRQQAEWERKDARAQAELHTSFDTAPSWMRLRQVAKDAVVASDQRVIDSLYVKDGEALALAAPQSVSRLSQEDAALLSALYDPAVAHEVEDELGIKLTELNFREQHRLLAYMMTAGGAMYDTLCQTLKQADEKARLLIAEAFLATEFGDDFGETLLTVVEGRTNETQKLLELISRLRGGAAKFADIFEGFDNELPTHIQRAIGERITEALYVAAELVQNDTTATARVLGNRITVTSMHEVVEALTLIETALTRIVEARQSGKTTSAYAERGSYAWHLGEESDVLVQIRPRGTSAGHYRKGVEYSEEGQINFSADVTSRDGEYVPVSIADARRRRALSIRLDLEGLLRDINGGKIGFDATRDILTAALDLGSLRGADPDNPNIRVARIISLGNKLRMRTLKQGRSGGYHTAMPEQYGKAVVFEDLAEFMIEKFHASALHRSLGVVALDLLPDRQPASQSEKAAA